MARLISILNLRGMYTLPPTSIPIQCDGALTKINWDSEEPNGTQIVIQTRVSFDGGFNWSEWKSCVNGGQIPDINEDTGLYNAQIIFRVIIQSNSYSNKPKLKEVSLHFEPVLVFDNKGDKICSPELWIDKNENGDISIINLSHNNEEFKISNLIDGEKIYFDNENQDIETSLVNTYRFKDFNDNYLNFPIGKNVLKIKGKGNLKFRYQFKFL